MIKLFLFLAVLYSALNASESNLKQAKAYYYGTKDVAKDYGKAKEYFLKAAQEGSPVAYRYLAGIYHYGVGVPVNNDRAKRWLEKAISLGDERSKVLYEKFFGIPMQEVDVSNTYESKEDKIARLQQEKRVLAKKISQLEEVSRTSVEKVRPIIDKLNSGLPKAIGRGHQIEQFYLKDDLTVHAYITTETQGGGLTNVLNIMKPGVAETVLMDLLCELPDIRFFIDHDKFEYTLKFSDPFAQHRKQKIDTEIRKKITKSHCEEHEATQKSLDNWIKGSKKE